MGFWSGFANSFLQLGKCPRELWIIYSMKILEATAMFCLNFILVKFLSEEMGMSDIAAGWVYGGYGTMVCVFGLLVGFLVDNLGVRSSLMLGGVLLLMSRVMIAFTQSSQETTIALLSVYALGSAMALPVQMMAMRRYTTEESRQFAFSVFYVFMNLSAASAAWLIHFLRRFASNGISTPPAMGGNHLTMYRIVLWASVVCTAVALCLNLLIREIRLSASGQTEAFEPKRASMSEIAREALSQPKFWRFFTITVIFVGVKSNFAHMDATFPKYFTREFGADAPFEVFLSINPVLIVFLVPLMTYAIDRLKLSFSQVLIIGSLVSGVAPFTLALWNSQAGCIAWLILVSVGESIWAPKLMELSVAIAPEGREGTYISLSGAPLFLSKLAVGGMSGSLLERFCPEHGYRHSQSMWFVIGLTTLLPALLLVVFQKQLMRQSDLDPTVIEEKKPLMTHKGQKQVLKKG